MEARGHFGQSGDHRLEDPGPCLGGLVHHPLQLLGARGGDGEGEGDAVHEGQGLMVKHGGG